MSQPTTPAPPAAPPSLPSFVPPSVPPFVPPAAWAPPTGSPVGPGAPWPSPVRPARRHRWVLTAVLGAVVVAALAVLGVGFAVGLRHDAAAAAAGTAAPLGAGLPPAGAAVPSAHPSAGLPPAAVPPPSAVLPAATVPPTGLGADPARDGEARSCASGEMAACVQLYLESYRDPALARYAAYGDTCAGRQPARTLRLCTASFPG